MRKVELDGRRIKISPVLEPEERFDRKRLGFVKCTIYKVKGIALHWRQINYEKKSITKDGQLIAYEDIDEEVQTLMKKWLTKLVATTVSSRAMGLKRRNETVTSSSHDEKTKKQQKNNKNSNFLQKQGQQKGLLYKDY